MTIDKLKPGMTVYSVGRQRMGNTTMTTVVVWPVRIIAVDEKSLAVTASWNTNTPRVFSHHEWSKWRLKKPLLIESRMGYKRIATREEAKAIKEGKDVFN